MSIGQLFGKDEETQLHGSPQDDEDLCVCARRCGNHFCITTVVFVTIAGSGMATVETLGVQKLEAGERHAVGRKLTLDLFI